MDAAWKQLGRDPGQHMRFCLLGRTAADVRDVMLEGPTGLLNIWPPSLRDKVIWTPSRRRIELPNGSVGLSFSGEEPDQLRGPAFSISWCDELAAFRQVRSIDGEATSWENLRIATRLGSCPQILATTTPKRVPVVRELLKEAQQKPGRVLLRRGRTVDNAYLPAAYLDVLLSLYGGTALGRQELEGEVLDAVAGAMTTETLLNRYRWTKTLPEQIEWIKLIGLDPSVAERPQDSCGIVVVYVSKTWPILHRHAWVMDDLSKRCAPDEWSKIVVKAAFEHQATVVAEINQGGAMVKQVLQMAADSLHLPMPPVNPTWSSKSKEARAEPVGAAIAQGRVHMVNVLSELESEMTSWTPVDAYSPDRQDALVQAAAAALFPEALISGLAGTASVLSVARQHLNLPRQVQLPRGPSRDRRVR